jgi:hypothetical protein
MKTTQYNPQIIQEFANKLFSGADTVFVVYVVLGVLLGSQIGGAIGEAVGLGWLGLVLGTLMGAGLGYFIGVSVGFQRKVRAQMLLCLVQMEENTRLAGSRGSAAAASTSISSTTPAAAPPAPLPAGVNARYYYAINGQHEGPIEAADLKLMRQDGLITADMPVLREGESQWRRFGDYPELK